ncbi:unnamed protein product [Mesocestoides corti]|uniref:ARID domain-containing protein n=1 Tax=Mesocestoides corti TaxID=53468 RepID=A0A0R3UJ86_MESCO|nr:unnamed protein product [Mesocestoides corti]
MAWSVDDEIKLFHALMYFKPVGLDRNFQMICLAYRLNFTEKLGYSVSDIWQHLSKLYNLEELNESEVIPFPNKSSEFSLPDEFKELQDLPFPRAKSSTVSFSRLPLPSGPMNRQRPKLGSSSSWKSSSQFDEHPTTPVTSSPSLSPRSVSSPTPSASLPTTAPSVGSKRTRKSLRSNTEQDLGMPPPPSSVSPVKVVNHPSTQAPRKSSRRHN